MPSAATRNIHHDAYITGRGRVMTDVMGLICARVDIDPGRALSEEITDPHKIQLAYEHLTCVVSGDHDERGIFSDASASDRGGDQGAGAVA